MTDYNQEPNGGDHLNESNLPKMSLFQTLTGIFFEPGEVFTDLRQKPFPRLIVPLILSALLVTGYSFAITQKLGKERIVREQLSSKWMDQVPEEAKQKMKDDAKNPSPVKDAVTSSLGAVFFVIVFAIIGLVYWGLAMAFGGEGNYGRALTVAVYASFPPIVVSMIASFIILFLKSADDISFMKSQQGLLKLNPTMFFEGSGIINAILGRFDLLVLWGMFLGALGLQRCFRISAGSSWIISIIIWVIGTLFAVLGGAMAG